MDNCVFCKIVKDELPSFKVYEDDNFVAFLDKFPRTPGHIQVVPKKHYRWIYDVPNFAEYFEAVKKIVEAVREVLSPRLVHLITIGDEVPHAHVHIVPRYEGDGHGTLIDIHKTIDMPDSEMDELAKAIAGKVS